MPTRENNADTCYNCSELIPEDANKHEVMGETWCESCTENNTGFCFSCDTLMDMDVLYRCSDTEYRCESCRDAYNEESDDYTREYSTELLPRFTSKEVGDRIVSDRIFSAEIEAYYPDVSSMQEVSRMLPREVGISGDGSLHENGIEIQTPQLQGKAGEELLREICNALNRYDFHVDSSAGLHIHLDGKGLIPRTVTKHEPYALKRMLVFYLTFEDIILSFLPHSRRANRYAEQLSKKYQIQEIMEAKSERDIEKIWYRELRTTRLSRLKEGKYHDSRYTGVNLHSLFRDGHLEIRYHSGTINAEKILHWTALHQSILDGAVGREEKQERVLFANPWEVATGLELNQKPQRMMYTVRIPRYSVDDCIEALSVVDSKEKTEVFFKLLELPLKTKAYLLSRQELFTSAKTGNGEAQSLNESCAG